MGGRVCVCSEERGEELQRVKRFCCSDLAMIQRFRVRLMEQWLPWDSTIVKLVLEQKL